MVTQDTSKWRYKVIKGASYVKGAQVTQRAVIKGDQLGIDFIEVEFSSETFPLKHSRVYIIRQTSRK